MTSKNKTQESSKAKAHWDYRMISENVANSYDDADRVDIYSIHEVYYSDGEPKTHGIGSVRPWGESLEELKDDVSRYIKALELPVLSWDGQNYKEEKK